MARARPEISGRTEDAGCISSIPPPKIIRHGRFLVVRDDLIVGGTKTRALITHLSDSVKQHVVYACDLFGFGPIALTEAARRLGMRVTLVYPAGVDRSPSFAALQGQPHVELVVRADLATQNDVFPAAVELAAERGAEMLPLGFDTPRFTAGLIQAAKTIDAVPQEVWSLAGSGCLTRALQVAWPNAQVHAVSMGFPHVRTGRAIVHVAPEAADETARVVPPYPSASYYDAKVWRFADALASDGALIWNVA